MRKGLKALLLSVIAARALLKLRRPPSCLMIIPNSASISGSRTESESKTKSEDRDPDDEEEESDTGPDMETDDDKEAGEPLNWTKASRAASGLLLWEYLVNKMLSLKLSLY